MKLLSVLILLSSLLLAQNKISFVDFVERVSLQNNINIYIDEDLNTTNISLFIPDKISNQELFTLFDSTLTKLDFDIKKFSKTYFIQKKAAAKSHQFIYKLKYNNYKNIDSLLLSLQLQYHYIVDNNSFVITTTKERFKEINSLLQELDTQQNQAILKITIFELQDSLIKDRGIQSIISKKEDNGVIESILSTVLSTPQNSTLTYDSLDFSLAVKFLDENKYISFTQKPYIFIKNNTPFLFNAVDNIPYLVKSTSTDSNVNQESNSIEYRDVGLKIQGISLIYNDYVNLDLDLIIEDIISSDTTTPSTYKRYLKSNTNLEFNKVLLLSGIKREKYTEDEYSIPFISNLPWLGELFKYKSKNKSEVHIAIAVEIIHSEKFNSTDFLQNQTPFITPFDSNNSDTS
jgi:general secretion pathway protein D